MGFRVDPVRWDVIGGVAVGGSVGCSSIPGEGVTALSEVAAGSCRQECNTGDAGEGDFQVKDDTKVMGSHIPVPSIAHPIDGASNLHPSLPGQQSVGRVQAQAGLRFLRWGAKSPETFLLIKV